MEQNLCNHIKSDKTKWAITGIALVLIFAILVGICLQVFGQGKAKPSEWFKKGESSISTKQVIEDALDVEIENTPQLLLAQNETVAVINADENRYLETSLSATVLPEEATNKDVLWTIEWRTESETDLSDYWQIVNTTNNNTVNIRLLKGGDNAYPAKVTATTVDGGFTASAMVGFGHSVYSMSVHSFYYQRKIGGKKETSVTVTPVSESMYQAPFYGRTYNSTVGGYDECEYSFCLYLLDFFGEKVTLGADSTFKQSSLYEELAFETSVDGVPTTNSLLRKDFDWYAYARYFYLSFNLVGKVENFTNGIDIKAVNSRTDKTVFIMKVCFTVPAESVSLSQTEIVL